MFWQGLLMLFPRMEPMELFDDTSLKVMSHLDLGAQRLHADIR